MANVESEIGWVDLGHFKSIKCEKLLGKEVCALKFTEGTFTATKKELKKMCGKI